MTKYNIKDGVDSVEFSDMVCIDILHALKDADSLSYTIDSVGK